MRLMSTPTGAVDLQDCCNGISATPHQRLGNRPLPDGRRLFESINDELARGERFTAMSGLHANQQRWFAHRDGAQTVDDADAVEWPTPRRLRQYLAQLEFSHLAETSRR